MSASVFPARAGMSPKKKPALGHLVRVPRASGDEPKNLLLANASEMCSPRERG